MLSAEIAHKNNRYYYYLRIVSLKEDRFLQFTTSYGNKFQSLMVAGKKSV